MLAALVVCIGCAFHSIGVGRDAELGSAFIHALEAMTWRSGPPASGAPVMHQLVTLLASIAGPVETALLVFAVRRRLRRTEHDFD
jgi:hypothetical protein